MINFGSSNFTVTIVWSQFGDETYTVTTVPEPVHTKFIMSTSIELVMLYNIQYNVTVTATLCGRRNTTNFTKHYSE